MRLERLIISSLTSALMSGWIFSATAFADNWQASIYEYGAPTHIVGVDKKKRKFNFFEKKSPFKLRYSYPCVTGQLPGDKQQINDLRTPEGIYFVEYKIANGLDFREYGGIAYTLNYPNPVDRLRGKTGHGIWIHSKGFELVPTRGCVAIDRANIAEVGPLLAPGTPVVLAEELKEIAPKDDGTLAELKGLMAEWSKTWAARSPKLFDFYDPEAYTKATENFSLFRQNKERLFKILSFIKIYNREINALEGPGYWVTWADQFYTASNLSTEGIRRLYWQKDPAGKFRIVGMEWTPRDVGMQAAFKKGTLVAEGPITTATDAEAPLAPRLDMPEQAEQPEAPAQASENTDSSAKGGLRASLTALAENLLALSEPLVPRRQGSAIPPDEIRWGEGKRLNELQPEDKNKQPVAQPEGQAAEKAKEASRPTPSLELPGAPKGPEKLVMNAALQTEIGDLITAWLKALQKRDNSIETFYDSKDYNRLPASKGVPRGKSLATTLQNIRRDSKQPWLEVINREPKLATNGHVVEAKIDLLLITPQGLRQGVQTLWWRKYSDGQFRIVGSDFRQQPLGLEANYLEQISERVAATLEDWRKAWEAGNLDQYISYYVNNATQEGRTGAANIRRQKENVWSRAKPVEVRFTGLRVSLDGAGARADMTQTYANSAGWKDKGVKTVYLRYDGKNWLIQREDWTKLP